MKLYFFRTFCVGALVACFFVLGNSASAAVITHSGETIISADTVWRGGDVHIIDGESASVSVVNGVKLTLEPGVIVKLSADAGFMVNGDLIVDGEPGNPVVFTSIKDDSVGGDTNTDGNATLPAMGDWYGFMAGNPPWLPAEGNINIKYAVIRYGGKIFGNDAPLFDVLNVLSFKVSSSSIINNAGNIIVEPFSSAAASIVNSNIYNPDFPQEIIPGESYYGMGGIENRSANILDFSGNYWGHANGPTIGSDIYGTFAGGAIDYQPFAVAPLDFNLAPVVYKRHPVIIIPGILGSWPDRDGKLILDPITHTYDDLYAALEQAGYTPGVTLFTFPYEWRNSNVVTAQLLKSKIAEVKASCLSSEIMDCSKVDLIGHSMGGLVARQYIESDDYNNDVDQMIFIATPHKGAPKAYMMWEGGFIGDTTRDKFLKIILTLEAGKQTGKYSDLGIVTYLHDYNINSVKELLPIYSYIYDENLGQVRHYPDNYPANPFLENLNSTANLDKLKLAVKIINIIGNIGDGTISGFSVVSSTKPLPMWESGMPNDFYGSKSGILTNSGDGTVPAISNGSFLDLTSITVNYDHGKAVSYAQSDVIKELTGSEPATEVHNASDIPNLLMISLRCPADIQVIAPDGKRLGRNINGSSTIAEIPGGYYFNSGDETKPEFVIIPNPIDGQYQVKVVGTDSGGPYTVDTNYITDATSTEAVYSGVVLPGQEQSLSFNFSSTSAPAPEIKSDITIQTAISDVSLIYDRGLLTDRLAKQKIIAKYAALKFKVTLADAAIKLAKSARIALINNTKLSASTKVKLLAALDSQLIKLRAERQKIIFAGLIDVNNYLLTLLDSGVLKQLGYDIIRSNNDYLINNW